MSIKLTDLKPKAQAAAEKALEDLVLRGIKCRVTSTLRTLAEQVALFAQGRSELEAVNSLRVKAGMYKLVAKDNLKTVTNCDGIKFKSNHQTGMALDVVPEENGRPVWPSLADPRWKEIAKSFKAQGFAWGGDWAKFPDYPHYEYKGE